MSANKVRERSASSDRVKTGKRLQLNKPLLISFLVSVLLSLSLLPLWWFQGSSGEVEISPQVFVTEPEIRPAIPLHVNAQVEYWLEEFRTTRNHELLDLLGRQGLFDTLIRGKLQQRGMPEDLVYLAMIESGFSPWAVSQVSAVGLWQFMGPTALQFGLRVDNYIDERRDPVRATDAALDYLEYLYTRFDSWYLAAAAYNAGPGRVERILKRHAKGRIGDEEIYWEVLRYLPRETRNYVPRLIAVSILAADAKASGVKILPEAPYEYDMVFVPGETYLSAVAESLGVRERVLQDLNPHLTRGLTPPNEIYEVRVPKGGSSTGGAALAPRRLVSTSD